MKYLIKHTTPMSCFAIETLSVNYPLTCSHFHHLNFNAKILMFSYVKLNI